jgi:hypothetical protein
MFILLCVGLVAPEGSSARVRVVIAEQILAPHHLVSRALMRSRYISASTACGVSALLETEKRIVRIEHFLLDPRRHASRVLTERQSEAAKKRGLQEREREKERRGEREERGER